MNNIQLMNGNYAIKQNNQLKRHAQFRLKRHAHINRSMPKEVKAIRSDKNLMAKIREASNNAEMQQKINLIMLYEKAKRDWEQKSLLSKIWITLKNIF